jgi:hypothetical protein
MMLVSGYTEPIEGIAESRLNLVNEAFVLLITYHLYEFTDFLTNLKARNLVGYSIVAITFINVGLNIAVVVSQTVFQVWRKLKLKYLALKQRNQIALLQKKKLAAENYKKLSLKVKADERLFKAIEFQT